MRRKLLAPFLITAMLGACASSQIAGRTADEPVPRRSAPAEEALQVTGGIIAAVLSLFSVVVVVH